LHSAVVRVAFVADMLLIDATAGKTCQCVAKLSRFVGSVRVVRTLLGETGKNGVQGVSGPVGDWDG